MDRLSGMMLDMGITLDLKGFECIKIGVSMLVTKKTGYTSMTKDYIRISPKSQVRHHPGWNAASDMPERKRSTSITEKYIERSAFPHIR